MKNGLRQVLCVMTLLSYHLIVLYVLSHQEGDLNACEDILKTQLSVRFHLFSYKERSLLIIIF